MLEEYARRHSYELAVSTEQTTDLPAPWKKIEIVRDLLDSHDEVLWIDADAIIVDTSEDIFDALGTDRGVGFVMHQASNLLPNTGVLALRSTPTTVDLLDAVWSMRHEYTNHIWWEQAAFCRLLGFVETRDGMLRLSQPTRHMLVTQFLDVEWNSVAIDQAPMPRVKHYPSTSHEQRLNVMTRDRELATRANAQPTHQLAAVFAIHDASDAELRQLLDGHERDRSGF